MSVSDEVRACEDRRCAAMLAGDVGALGELLSERLSFVHSNGRVDPKAVLLEKMAAGGIRYHAITWSEPQVEARGELVALHGIMQLDVAVSGVDKTLHNRAIQLWERAGEAWKLLYFQSTPIS